ncbi:MAG TPA: 2-dehydropantoate 2-reductase [Candidatus Acidoferrales bacterium]|nr:2-dehydropantoate 2-reductase [Candidatus Acidoferrales bacterium]
MATSQADTTNAKSRVAVMGAGAVGSYFGGMLARAGVSVTLIGRRDHLEAIRRDRLFLDTVTFQERVAVEASTDPAAVAGADVVLFCVKGVNNEAASRSIARHLAANAIVVSLQNGVDNVETIRAASGIDALPAVVYIAAALPEPGHLKHLGRGELAIGERVSSDRPETASSRFPRTEKIAALFQSAGVPCRISEYIEGDIWAKFIMNCAGNAVTAIAQCTYAQAAENPASRELMTRLIEETVAVARAAGIRLPKVNFIDEGIKSLGTFGTATSSTAHDLARGKRSEIEFLNGHVARLGQELGVATPCNFSVYAMVKLLEESGVRNQQARPATSSQ